MSPDPRAAGPALEMLLESDPRLLLLLATGVAFGVGLFLRGFRAWRHLRLVEDTPTSKVRSLALGRVEVRGHAQPKAELAAPFTGVPCVFHRWQVEHEERSRRGRRWRTIAQGSSEDSPFFVEDETGRVLVDPRGAALDLDPSWREQDPPFAGPLASFAAEHGIDERGFFGFPRKLRFTEWRIDPGDPLYVLGVAQERPDLARERRTRIAARLAERRADPEAMQSIDADGDGRVSGDEWEVARRDAVLAVEREGFEDRVVLGAQRGAPFYLSRRSEREVMRRNRWGAAGGVFGGALLALASLAGLLQRLEIPGR